jgi:hypothetical protein
MSAFLLIFANVDPSEMTWSWRNSGRIVDNNRSSDTLESGNYERNYDVSMGAITTTRM